MDPTCGEAVFLLAAGRELKAAGCQPSDLDQRLYGVDLHGESLAAASRLLEAEGLDAHLLADDFFAVATPDQLGSPLPYVDAVVGNPPFVRTSSTAHRRQSSAVRVGRTAGRAAQRARILVGCIARTRLRLPQPEGRLAMVLPAELLTVSYAEPVRAWLRRRFEVAGAAAQAHRQARSGDRGLADMAVNRQVTWRNPLDIAVFGAGQKYRTTALTLALAHFGGRAGDRVREGSPMHEITKLRLACDGRRAR